MDHILATSHFVLSGQYNHRFAWWNIVDRDHLWKTNHNIFHSPHDNQDPLTGTNLDLELHKTNPVVALSYIFQLHIGTEKKKNQDELQLSLDNN